MEQLHLLYVTATLGTTEKSESQRSAQFRATARSATLEAIMVILSSAVRSRNLLVRSIEVAACHPG